MKFGEKLKQARKAASMTQTELGEKIGVGKNTIINWEGGKTYPHNRDTYSALASILDVGEGYLYNEDELPGSQIDRALPSELAGRVAAMFAGGEMADEDMDKFMSAVNRAYWEAKEKRSKKQ